MNLSCIIIAFARPLEYFTMQFVIATIFAPETVPFFSLTPIYYTLVFKDRKGLQPQGNSKAEKEIKSKL